ncbi:FGGY-family carbohydrate kinase [Labrys wisconsinensis]|uniref:Ribulose kinase n=1 Tax=Labrys wisconsinensis TaxID=425677 RepID=A0ABU0JLX2_9HYPH|nr:FGGY-family carbohydrate kinase [Labrys wisconsinensis]MDQ0474481.1 ribulose kinase [Labrys wisconsinensis]
MSFVIGIDGGTESLRARVYDLSGTCKGTAAHPYDTAFSAGARAEQDPEDWWRAAGLAVRQAVAEAGIAPEAVEAIALATTSCTVVALDEAGRALRPAIIWMDVRAEAEAADVLATGDPALVVNCAGKGPVSAEWMVPKALWIARHEPDLFARAATICEYQDFMSLRLTGRRCASLDNVSIRWHFSTLRGGYPASLLTKLGLEALLAKWPAEVVAPGEVIGTLTPEASAHLGLGTHVKVAQGGADAFIGMIGLGVSQPGQLALITGSSHLMFGVSAKPVSVDGLWGTYADAVYPGRHIIEGGQTSTGSIIAWLRRLAGGSLDFAALNAEAAKLEPGCDGLLVLDHFQGNRTPYVDALSRGAFVGLTLAHGMPHLFRAVMEGISFGTRAILDGMTAAGFAATEITIGGGATSSDLWLQIHADAAGLPVSVPAASEAPALGAAILAGVAGGRFASIDEGIAAMVRPGRRIEPRPRERALYDALYRRYAELYPALKPFTPRRADA